MSKVIIKTPFQQLEEQIRDVAWNVYRTEDEDAEGGAVQYRMNRIMDLIHDFMEASHGDTELRDDVDAILTKYEKEMK